MAAFLKKYFKKISATVLSLLFILVLFSCGDSKEDRESADAGSNNNSLDSINNPVLPGDFADPSVVRVGDDYWATATSSEWAPLFPILHSSNLQDWEIQGHVFPENLPEWAEAHFWAPEIIYDNNKFYIYYTAKQKDGPLCVGVASSENATGPYEDHGPIVCQEAGAIDGFQIRDDEGKLYLIWKEDGNSRGEPTPNWGQEMNEERTELIGEKFELFRNDPGTWEGNLVEGIYILKKNGYYYAFYSGDACCGRGCTYGVGVARAKELRGPWEKYQENPLKRENDEWQCAGHGSMVQTDDGRYFFLYHAYSKDGFVYTGRQGLLDEVVWGEDGWPKFRELGSKESTGTAADQRDLNIENNFDGGELSPRWQWPVGNKPSVTLEDGSLSLQSKPEQLGALLGQRTLSPDYEAVTAIQVNNSEARNGLAAFGDQNNAVGISYSGDEVLLWKVQDNNEEIVARSSVSDASEIHLKMEVSDGEQYSFSWSPDGNEWNNFDGDNELNGHYLPPWDRAIRVGLVSKGPEGAEGVFDFFRVESKK